MTQQMVTAGSAAAAGHCVKPGLGNNRGSNWSWAGRELGPAWLLRGKSSSLSSKHVRCRAGAGELEQQPLKEKLGLLHPAQDSRTLELRGEVAGGCRELVAGGALFILLIYDLVCCWLELKAELGASMSSGTCWPRACLAGGVCRGG